MVSLREKKLSEKLPFKNKEQTCVVKVMEFLPDFSSTGPETNAFEKFDFIGKFVFFSLWLSCRLCIKIKLQKRFNDINRVRIDFVL